MLGLVILLKEARNDPKQKAEKLCNFFFMYGRHEKANDFFHNLDIGGEFIKVPDEFRDKLDRTNFEHFVRRPTIQEIKLRLTEGRF